MHGYVVLALNVARHAGLDLPRVVPALCIVYWMFLAFFNRRWTAATSLETEAVGVPIGMRQKSVVGVEHLMVNKGLVMG